MKKIKLAYIGGGSKMWANIFMSDLSLQKDLCGEICLYDIDYDAALRNQKLGNIINECSNVVTKWDYTVSSDIDNALINADVVVISILPGTFEEMASDVHAPEKYGIYQSVGDTTGPGGILRAMRTVPIFEFFGKKIKEICPDAIVVNLTNPLAICVKTLYSVYPRIKAFGCCHEVFNTQDFLCKVIEKELGVLPSRKDLSCNITGVNHFTWMTRCYYGHYNVFNILKKFIKNHYNEGLYEHGNPDDYKTNPFAYGNLVKMDLFKKYGILPCAGDRHLVEFMDPKTYLASPEVVAKWHFALTSVDYRIQKANEKIEYLNDVVSGKTKFELKKSNEEAVDLIKALLGLGDAKSNINMPNCCQATYLPAGSVVESNCLFSQGSFKPDKSTYDLPKEVVDMISLNAKNQIKLHLAILSRDMDAIYNVFKADPLCKYLNEDDAKALFKEMVENTKKYLEPFYDLRG